MRILTVVFSLGKGGTERAAVNFALGYAEIGHDSRLLYTREAGIRKELLEKRKIVVYDFMNENDCSYLSGWRPDIVHLHSLGITLNEFAKIKAIFPSAKFIETNVFSVPSPWADQIDLSFQLLQWCDWLFRKRSKKKFSSAIIPNPIDTSVFRYSGEERVATFRKLNGISLNDFVIGRVGQQFDGKWSISLIDIFDSLKKTTDNLKLIVVSPPEIIIGRIKKSPYYSDIIHIDQILDDGCLADLYSSLDIFVLISEQGESFGMVIAESLLCQTPVVTLSTPWADNSQGEVVGNRIGGFVAANISAVEGLIDKLIKDKSLRNNMGLNGRNRIVELYNSSKVATDALKLLASRRDFVAGGGGLRR